MHELKVPSVKRNSGEDEDEENRGRVRERDRREVLSRSFRVIDRSGAWCIDATGSNETCTSGAFSFS